MSISTRSEKWGGYNYAAKEFDHYEREFNDDAMVSAAIFTSSLSQTGSGKSAKLAEEIKNIAVKKLKMKYMSHPETENNDTIGVYILKNENILLEIAYYSSESEDKKTITPAIGIAFINKNYLTSFEEQEKIFVKNFLEGDIKNKK